MSEQYIPDSKISSLSTSVGDLSGKLQNVSLATNALDKLTKLNFEKATKALRDFATAGDKFTALQNGFKGVQKGAKEADGVLGKLSKTTTGLSNVFEKIAAGALIAKGLEQVSTAVGKINTQLKGVESGFKIFAKAGVDPTAIQQLEDFGNALTNFDTSGVEEFATSVVAQYSQVTSRLSDIATISASEIEKAGGNTAKYLSRIFDETQTLVNDQLQNTVTSMQALDATYVALQAGIEGSATQGAVTNTLKLITAQGGSAEGVMALLKQTMTAFNMSATESGTILGKLTKVVDVGITSIPELQNGFGQLAVSATAAGLNIDEVGGSLAQLTLAGSDTYGAMTRLYNLFNQITSGQITERLAGLGVSLGGQAVKLDRTTIQTKGFAQALRDVNVAIGGSKQSWRQLLPDSEALAAVFGLLASKSDTLESTIQKVAKAGAKNLEDAFNVKIDQDKIQNFSQILNRVGELTLKLGKLLSPIFDKALGAIEKLVDKAAYIIENYSGVIETMVKLNLALKVVTTVIGTLIGLVVSLTGTWLAYRTVTNKILGDIIGLGRALTNTNKAIQTSNLLWSQQTNLLQKVAMSFGQLLGVYNIEERSLAKLAGIKNADLERNATLKAKEAAVSAVAQKNLEAQAKAFENLSRIQNGVADTDVLSDKDKARRDRATANLNNFGENKFDRDTVDRLDRKEKRASFAKLQREQFGAALKEVDTKNQLTFTSTDSRLLKQRDALNKQQEKLKLLRAQDPSTLTAKQRNFLGKVGGSLDEFATGIDVANGTGTFTGKKQVEGLTAKKALTKLDDAKSGKFNPFSTSVVDAFGGLGNSIGDRFSSDPDGRKKEREARQNKANRNKRARELRQERSRNSQRRAVAGRRDLLRRTGRAAPGITGVLDRASNFVTGDKFPALGKSAISASQSFVALGGATAVVSAAFLGLAAGAVLLAANFVKIDQRNKKLADGLGASDPGSFIGDFVDSLGLLKKKADDVSNNFGIFGDVLRFTTNTALYPLMKAIDAVKGSIRIFQDQIDKYTFRRQSTIVDKVAQDVQIGGVYTSSSGRVADKTRFGLFGDVQVEQRDAKGVLQRDKNGNVIQKSENLGSVLSELRQKDKVTIQDSQRLGGVIAATEEDLQKKLSVYQEQTNFLTKQEGTLAQDLSKNIGGENGAKFIEILKKEAEATNINKQLQDKNLSEVERKNLKDRAQGLKLTEEESKIKSKIEGESNQSQKQLIESYKNLALATNASTLATAKFKETVEAVSGALQAFATFYKNKADFTGNEGDQGKTPGSTPEAKALFRSLSSTKEDFVTRQKEFETLRQGIGEEGLKKLNDQLKPGQTEDEQRKIIESVLKTSGKKDGDFDIDAYKRVAQYSEFVPKTIKDQLAKIQQLVDLGELTGRDAAKQFNDNVTSTLKPGDIDPTTAGNLNRQEFGLIKAGSDKYIEQLERQKSSARAFAEDNKFYTEDSLREIQELEAKQLQERFQLAKDYFERVKALPNDNPERIAAQREIAAAEREILKSRLNQQLEFINKQYSVFQEGVNKQLVIVESLRNDDLFFNPDLNKRQRELETLSLQATAQQAQKNFETIKEDPKASLEAKKNALLDYEKAKADLIQKGYQNELQATQDAVKKIELIYSVSAGRLKEQRLLTGDASLTESFLKEQEDQREQSLKAQLASYQRLVEEGGKTGKELLQLESNIRNTRVQLLESFVDAAIRQYDRLAKSIEASVLTKEVFLKGLEVRNNARLQSGGNQVTAYEQSNSVLDTALNSKVNDLEFEKNTVKSESAKRKIAKEILDLKLRTFEVQLMNERKTLELQQQQLELQLKLADVQQRRSEIQAESEYKKSLIEREKAYLTGDENDIAIAEGNVAIAGEGVVASRLQRQILKQESVLRRNELAIKAYTVEQTARSREDDAIGDYVGSTKTISDDKKEAKRRRNRSQLALPELYVPDGVEIDESTIRAELQKQDNKVKPDLARIKRNLEQKAKDLGDPLNAKVSNLSDAIAKDQLKTLNSILEVLRNQRIEPYKPKKNNDKPSAPSKFGTVEDITKTLVNEMLAQSGRSGKGITSPKVVFKPDSQFKDGAEGYYKTGENTITLKESDRKALLAGGESQVGLLVHELRHWMQDNKLTNGNLNLDKIKNPEDLAFVKNQGLKVSGDSPDERDAYTYQVNYTKSLIDKLSKKHKDKNKTPIYDETNSIQEPKPAKQNKPRTDRELNALQAPFIYDPITNESIVKSRINSFRNKINTNNKVKASFNPQKKESLMSNNTSQTVNNNRNTNVALSPTITISINSNGDQLPTDIKQQINNQLYNLLNEAQRRIG